MDPRVQEFLTKTAQEIETARKEEEKAKAEEERKKREKILMAAGLYDEETVYESQRPTTYYDEKWGTVKKDGQWLYFKKVKKLIDVSDEEYSEILKAMQEKEAWTKKTKAFLTKENKLEEAKVPEEIEIEPNNAAFYYGSSGAKFLRVIAWILWIGGLIASIVSANATVMGVFSWTLFMSSALTYFFEGGVVMCAAEGLDNLQAIRDAVTGFRGFTAKRK